MHSFLCNPCTVNCAWAVCLGSFRLKIILTELASNNFYLLLILYILKFLVLSGKRFSKPGRVAQFLVIQRGNLDGAILLPPQPETHPNLEGRPFQVMWARHLAMLVGI